METVFYMEASVSYMEASVFHIDIYCSVLQEIKSEGREMGYVKGRTGRITTVVVSLT
jgi:hypothetical protein